MIISDFDGVLFDTERFKADQMRIFRALGISQSVQRTAYLGVKARHGGYRHDLHYAAIKKAIPSFDPQDIQEKMDALLLRSGRYLYSDAKPFLAYWKRRKQKVALVSSGFAFQKKKVAASGLRPFFHPAVVTTSEFKVEPVRAIVKKNPGERVVFMDDRKEVVDAIKKHFPSVFVIQVVRRSGQERSIHADAVVKNLAAARALCEKVLHPMRAGIRPRAWDHPR